MRRLVVRIYGGLGNQMFQYAAARALAWRHRLELLLETSLAVKHRTRPYRLEVFRLSSQSRPPAATRWTLRAACSRRPLVRRLGKPLLRAAGLELVREARPYCLDPCPEARASALRAGRILCLDGYWQCPRYFAGAEERIRREFSFRDPPDDANRTLLLQIASADAVSVHIRRGDYLNLKEQPVLSPAYYQRAAALIAARLPRPRFFVFSDDFAWVRAKLRLPGTATFVEHNGEARAAEDLRLMSACRHHVIANSSFSWWGAWLNPAADKIVVAPKYWGRSPDSHFPQLFPPGWIPLEDLP